MLPPNWYELLLNWYYVPVVRAVVVGACLTIWKVSLFGADRAAFKM